jgi:hypothetical protein
MAGFPLGRVAEQTGYIRVTFHVGLFGEVEVSAIGLGFPGERVLKILMGPGALE